jgi:energy-coupling factor transporter transmembrane protein EcfT
LSDSSRVVNESLFLQPPPGRRYVRSFLFSRRIDAPFAQVHLIARTILVLCMSSLQLRAINATRLDPVAAALLWLLALLLFSLSGMRWHTARIYLLLTVPTLLSLFITWALFNPVPGQHVLLRSMIYPGNISIGVSLWMVVWLAIVAGYFWWTRKLAIGILVATVVAVVIAHLFALPGWTFVRTPFFHPLTVLISDRGLLIALTKVVGYCGMVFSTIALVVTSRDVELMGALRQLRMPQPVIFFLGTVFRALNLALADYGIIHQAQIARAINARPRSFIRQIRDFASTAVPLVAMMIRRSSEIGDALMARGYSLRRGSADFYETSPWRLIDWLVLIFSLFLLYLTLDPRINLTSFVLYWF